MFKLILGKLGELVLSKVGESFLSNVVNQTTDNALNNINTIKDFELILKTLYKKLKSLSAKASDVEEEIKNAELSHRKKRKREVEEWLEEVKTFEKEVEVLGSQVETEGFIRRLMDGGNTAKLNEEIDRLVEQCQNFGDLVLDVYGTSGDTIFLTNGLVGEAFSENLDIILRLLEGREVSSIGIYGMGGAGKTTLAKHINNRLLQRSEECVFWVTVSQEFSVTSLQDKIARLLGVDLSDEDNEDKRATRLHRTLSEMKNSVLILDDVWENIDLIDVGCPFSVNCCRLVVTTRSLEVCRRICCERVIRVEKLREDEAWKLFCETLKNEIELVPQVEEIAKSMTKMCDGLPLGIISLAGSMRGEKSIHTWTNALAELKDHVTGQNGMGDIRVFKVLKYSFDRLNNQSSNFNTFQLCFMYCSLYPEDYEIVRDHLVSKIISGGLVDERKSRRARVEQGHFILDKLVNLCLLESCVDYDGKECVKMHDLVRGMALKIGEGKYMVRGGDQPLNEIYVPDEEEWTKDLEKVSLMMSGIRRIEYGVSPNCPNLTTLLLWSNPLDHIPDSFFSKMQGLCTLDLCDNRRIVTLPNSVGDMMSLKSLLLEDCIHLENVPYLGKLKRLRELNISRTAIKEVPQGLGELLNLKSLSIDAPRLKMLPRRLLLKLRQLQHLCLPFDIQLEFEEIEHLIQLEEFGGGVNNVNDFNRFIRTRAHDPSYRVGVRTNSTFRFRFQTEYNNELALFACNLKDEKVLGQGIVYLTISACEGLSTCFLDDLSQLNNPTSLKKLTISKCGGIEFILRGDQVLPSSQISTTLEGIELVGLPDLKGVMQNVETEAASPAPAPAQLVFSFLKRLSVGNCCQMRKTGLPVSRIPNLELIHIWLCEKIEEIFEDEGRGHVTLPKLQVLCLNGLPCLKSVSKATMMCNSITTISITKCPRLMKILPLHFDDPPPPSLGFIRVEREWWESLVWDINPNLPQLLHPFLDIQG